MDVGQSLNPAIDIGQIEGAFIQVCIDIGLYMHVNNYGCHFCRVRSYRAVIAMYCILRIKTWILSGSFLRMIKQVAVNIYFIYVVRKMLVVVSIRCWL